VASLLLTRLLFLIIFSNSSWLHAANNFRPFHMGLAMLSLQRLMKLGYVLALGSAVFVLSRPAPVRVQRTIAYALLPGQLPLSLARGQLLSTAATPMVSYTNVKNMLEQAASPVDPFGVGMSGAQPLQGPLSGVSAGGGGLGGGGLAGMRGGMGGGLIGVMVGMGGGLGGMGGMNRGGMGGMGGMNGFAGKGFGGFNGKKPL
jgi:hypothetical protein